MKEYRSLHTDKIKTMKPNQTEGTFKKGDIIEVRTPMESPTIETVDFVHDGIIHCESGRMTEAKYVNENQTEGSTGVENEAENLLVKGIGHLMELDKANEKIAACLAALKELIPIAEMTLDGITNAYEFDSFKSAIERAKAITSK